MPECLPDLPRYIRQHEDGSWHGADDREGPWRPIPAPQSGLPWKTDGPAVPESREPASVAADPTPHSPAAQIVWQAYGDCFGGVDWVMDSERRGLVAAIRAAADRAEDLIGDTEHPKFTEGVLAATHFLDLIATELEANR
jgi:hypothetical protein